MINEIYNGIETHDEKEDVPFSILKLGLTIWQTKVMCKKNIKILMKTTVIIFKQYLKHKKAEMIIRKNKKQF